MKKLVKVQEVILSLIETKIKPDEMMVDVIMKLLFISKDAAYRRMKLKVPFTIEETKLLCDHFEISFDKLVIQKKDTITFSYNSPSTIDYNFDNYLISLHNDLELMSKEPNQNLIISVNDTPFFQMFNFPRLTAFKLFFWAKSYLKVPEFADVKFGEEIIRKYKVPAINRIRDIYNSIDSSEVYCPETLRGVMRQVQYYFQADLFESREDAMNLLIELEELTNHLRSQAEIGEKFAFDKPEYLGNGKFNMYFNETYLPDNTYYFMLRGRPVTYFTHNIMNYIQVDDDLYNKDTKALLDQLIENSVLISNGSIKERNRFFSNLLNSIESFKRKLSFDDGYY